VSREWSAQFALTRLVRCVEEMTFVSSGRFGDLVEKMENGTLRSVILNNVKKMRRSK